MWQALEGRVHNVREIVTGVFTFIGLGLAALSIFLVMEEVRDGVNRQTYTSINGWSLADMHTDGQAGASLLSVSLISPS